MSAEQYVLVVWLTGALATAAYIAAKNREQLDRTLAREGIPDTRVAKIVVVAAVASVWFVMPFLLLADRKWKP